MEDATPYDVPVDPARSLAEVRHAHDVLVPFYAERLAGALDRMPANRAVLGLFRELVRAVGDEVADVGCGTGRLVPYLAAQGLRPRGVDASSGMVAGGPPRASRGGVRGGRRAGPAVRGRVAGRGRVLVLADVPAAR